LQVLEEKFADAAQLEDLQQFEQALQALYKDIVSQKAKMPTLEKKINAKERMITKKIAGCKVSNEKQQWHYLFSTLEQGIENGQRYTEQDDYQALNAFWQKKIKELASKKTEINREEATLELEILSGIPSPSKLQQRRMTVQVNLMQSQMSSGAAIDLPAKFYQWLLSGKLTEQDLVLLQRIKPIFQ
jgi:hypothetical protein